MYVYHYNQYNVIAIRPQQQAPIADYVHYYLIGLPNVGTLPLLYYGVPLPEESL
jgi:hypothetical protein